MAGIEYPQLKADNFNNWLFRVECILDEKQLKGNLTSTSDNLTGDALTKYQINDAKARSIIVQCVPDKHLNLIKDSKTAKEMIDILKKLFQRKSVVSKLHLRRKLLTLKCNNMDKLEDYFLEFDNLIRELECTGVKIDDMDKVCYLLVGLDSKYDTVITAIETIQEDCTLEFVKSRLLDEELKLSNKVHNNTVSNNEHAFKVICYKCQKPGHIAQECTQNQNQTYRRGYYHGNFRRKFCRPNDQKFVQR